MRLSLYSECFSIRAFSALPLVFCLFVISLVAISLCCFYPQIVRAEGSLYECAGVWQTEPCASGAPAKTLKKRVKPERSPEETAADKKRFLLLELDLLRFDASRELDRKVSISEVKAVCDDSGTSLKECAEAVSGRRAAIETQLDKAKLAREAAAKATPTPAQPNTNQTAVTIVQPVPLHGRRPGCCRSYCRYHPSCRRPGIGDTWNRWPTRVPPQGAGGNRVTTRPPMTSPPHSHGFSRSVPTGPSMGRGGQLVGGR